MAKQTKSTKSASTLADSVAGVAAAALADAIKQGRAILAEAGQDALAEADKQLKELASATLARATGEINADEFAETLASHEAARESLLVRAADVNQRKAFKVFIRNTLEFFKKLAGLLS